ncbi:MAG TPA: hypothetical protein VLZ30_06780 [Verrucomicrobiae bacterium]|nr:hypothetical protein [Verrucomicrobiae bacterium]
MAAYRILRGWVALFLAGYFALGFSTLLLPGREIFPVSSWSLFALVPGQESRYALRLLEAGGQKLAEPVLYQDAEGLVANPHSVAVREIVQQFGLAVEQGRIQEQLRIRRMLEKDHLPSPCRYELVTISYDPLVRWRTGRYEVRPLAHYASPGVTP